MPSSPGNLLHPDLPRGLPAFIPSFSAPAAITRLPPARQLEALRRRGGAVAASASSCSTASGCSASGGRSRPRGSSTARLARYPDEVEAQVAGAVGQFDKDAPERAFGRLGPLSQTYPNEPTVRFHLGVLLLWTGRIQGAERQFRLAAKAQPGSPLAREAARYLETIRQARS